MCVAKFATGRKISVGRAPEKRAGRKPAAGNEGRINNSGWPEKGFESRGLRFWSAGAKQVIYFNFSWCTGGVFSICKWWFIVDKPPACQISRIAVFTLTQLCASRHKPLSLPSVGCEMPPLYFRMKSSINFVMVAVYEFLSMTYILRCRVYAVRISISGLVEKATFSQMHQQMKCGKRMYRDVFANVDMTYFTVKIAYTINKVTYNFRWWRFIRTIPSPEKQLLRHARCCT